MLEHGVEHGPEHTQNFSILYSTLSTISCSRCFITSPVFEHADGGQLAATRFSKQTLFCFCPRSTSKRITIVIDRVEGGSVRYDVCCCAVT